MTCRDERVCWQRGRGRRGTVEQCVCVYIKTVGCNCCVSSFMVSYQSSGPCIVARFSQPLVVLRVYSRNIECSDNDSFINNKQSVQECLILPQQMSKPYKFQARRDRYTSSGFYFRQCMQWNVYQSDMGNSFSYCLLLFFLPSSLLCTRTVSKPLRCQTEVYPSQYVYSIDSEVVYVTNTLLSPTHFFLPWPLYSFHSEMLPFFSPPESTFKHLLQPSFPYLYFFAFNLGGW